MGLIESYQLAEHINQFYLDAFDHALAVVGIVFGAVGIVVPAVIAFFQVRQAKKGLEQLRSRVSEEVMSQISVVEGKLIKQQADALVAFQERSDKLVADLREEVRKKVAAVDGAAYHVQALTASNSKHSKAAVRSACDAIRSYVIGEDFVNLRRVCAKIAIPQLRKIDGDSLGRLKAELVEGCEDAIESMESADKHGHLTDLVRDLRAELAACLDRKAAPKDDDSIIPAEV